MGQDIYMFSLTFCSEKWIEKLSQQSYFIFSFCVAGEVHQEEIPCAWKANPSLLSSSHLCHGEEDI